MDNCGSVVVSSRKSRKSVLTQRMFVAWLACISPIVLPAVKVDAQAATDIKIAASPAVVQASNGKLPASIPLAVTAKACDKDVDLHSDTLFIAAAGLSFSAKPAAGQCALTTTLSIDPNAPPGNYKIVLMDANGKPVGSTDFAVLETTAGPIPSGLAPQVDVLWEVLSQKVCNDVFGKRVARNFYCIEVKIGNNTGHPLQLAGIGFAQHLDQLPGHPQTILANTSYASTRAVLLRESVLSPRNIFYHGVQATGLVMAGFIPYFHAANATAHYATAVAIVTGPLLQAINIVGPDRVVSQLNNLDDESFRDNQIIPNNTQVRTIVFIEKLALSELLDDLPKRFPTLFDADGTKDGGPAKGARVAGKNSGGSAQPGMNATRTRMLDKTQRNSEQRDTTPIFKFRTGDFSPLLVKLALGDLVVIGDEIQYLQRVQVQGAASGGASSLSVVPSRLDFGSQSLGSATKAQVVTVTNSGSSAISGLTTNLSGTHQQDFSKTSTCSDSGTLEAGASCTISVTFTPGDQQARAGTLTVAYSGGVPQTVSLSGVGVP